MDSSEGRATVRRQTGSHDLAAQHETTGVPALPGVKSELVKTEAIKPETIKAEPEGAHVKAGLIKAHFKAGPIETHVKPEQMEYQDYRPRDQGDPFGDLQQDEVEAPIRGLPLQQIAKGTTTERLEAGVRTGLEALAMLEEPLSKMEGDREAKAWLEQIANVRKDAARSRTVVGVVGNTGAGKSSVINAMLEEERLVPTNCMRACTAVVTEMSYNDSTNEASKYRAQVEFIKPEDWRKELDVLFAEIFDEEGRIVREASNPDSQAGIAYAKIRAVYHKFTKDMLSRSSVDALMRVPMVQTVLGTTKYISERTPDAFYRRLQYLVDSKEKNTEKKDKNGNKITNPKREFEYWPLIKVVKIYTKADALSTGAIIVDLPGVHDSNAARAAVAEGYMKQCTGLWIVAPINRAVDDKAAKTLLGDTFKRQLKFDGSYSAVTFICSKTDDISRTEAADSLELGDEFEELDERLIQIVREKRALTRNLTDLKARKSNHADAIDSIDDSIEQWEDCGTMLEVGKTVYAPTTVTMKKRKRSSASASADRAKKRRTSGDSDDDDDFVVSDNDVQAEEAASMEEGAQGLPLTQEEIDDKLDELKKLKKEARREKIAIEEEIRENRMSIAPLDEEEERIDAIKSAKCIAGRNEYSRGAIRLDFAAGIRELDQENAEEEDPDNFNPDEDIRDYEKVAQTLPVFCVSSRAYQKLSGRFLKDQDLPGFETKDQTEIPQLQVHCKLLTVSSRQARARRFLNGLTQLLTSLGLWASDDGTGAKLTTKQRDDEKSFLTRELVEFERALEKAVNLTLEDARETLTTNVFDKFNPAIETAARDALPTSSGWGAHRNDGGLFWATYKATVRRQGVYAGASGARDFNQELAEPIYKQLASAWEKAFQRRLPQVLQAFTKAGGNLLKSFHAAVEARCLEKGHGASRIGLLKNQLNVYQELFKDLATSMVEQINNEQREINRQFTPVIAQIMEHAYTVCTEERGTGSYKRMKAAMVEHVTANQETMFQQACDQVQTSLDAMCTVVSKSMLDRADGIYTMIQRDYFSIIGNVQLNERMSREERHARGNVDDAISALDTMFKVVVDSAEADLEIIAEQHGQNAEDEVVQDDGGDVNGMEDHGTNDAEEDSSKEDGNEENLSGETKGETPGTNRVEHGNEAGKEDEEYDPKDKPMSDT